jgi:hypothetical protein
MWLRKGIKLNLTKCCLNVHTLQCRAFLVVPLKSIGYPLEMEPISSIWNRRVEVRAKVTAVTNVQ